MKTNFNFKQSQYIKLCKNSVKSSRSKISKEELEELYKAIEDGMCYVLCYGWVKSLLSGTIEPEKRRVEVLGAAAMSAEFYKNHKTSFTMRSALNGRFKVKAKWTAITKDYGKEAQKISKNAQKKYECFILVIRLEGGYHAIGIYHKTQNLGWKALIFDPNHGEMEYSGLSYKEFGGDLNKHLKKYGKEFKPPGILTGLDAFVLAKS